MICEEYARRYPHIKYISFSENRGTNAGRNAAINAATGDWIIILDSDDYFTDDAIQTIHQTIISHPNFMHYMFAPEDMLPKYANSYLLKGKEMKILSFPDFLGGAVREGFIHVMKPEVLLKYPFDESVRIYEEVFFFNFYKVAKRILFVKKVVVIRERSRLDSVTRETFRTSKLAIERNTKSRELCLNWFEQDYVALGLIDALCNVYNRLVDNYLLLGKYDLAAKYIGKLKARGYKLKLLHKMVFALRIGWLYRNMLKLYLSVKYKIIKQTLD
ncbi:MAG: glycosyltransferase [Prevotella sp.]|nr:glycosyltransferase [Prevotella sp.]